MARIGVAGTSFDPRLPAGTMCLVPDQGIKFAAELGEQLASV